MAFHPSWIPTFCGYLGSQCEINDHFKRIADNNLTFEELATLLCQIEGCLNSRQLCPMTADLDDTSILTPGHFLVGDSLLAVPEQKILDTPTGRLTLWQLLQSLHQEFWHKWSTEYLSRLQQRPK